jgi:hypothetical protein
LERETGLEPATVLLNGRKENLPTLGKIGAGDGTRTRDSLLGGQELYQLSYSRVCSYNFNVKRICCQKLLSIFSPCFTLSIKVIIKQCQK